MFELNFSLKPYFSVVSTNDPCMGKSHEFTDFLTYVDCNTIFYSVFYICINIVLYLYLTHKIVSQPQHKQSVWSAIFLRNRCGFKYIQLLISLNDVK